MSLPHISWRLRRQITRIELNWILFISCSFSHFNFEIDNRVPVIDHMWQTETGGPAFGNPYGIDLLPIKPGSATIPLPGIDAAIVSMEGEPCAPGEEGIMTIRRPFPGLRAVSDSAAVSGRWRPRVGTVRVTVPNGLAPSLRHGYGW